MSSIGTVETARLRGERVAERHFADLCRLHRDPLVMKTLSADGNRLPDEETRTSLVRQMRHWDEHGFGLWVFREKAGGAFVGRGGIQKYLVDGVTEIGLAYAVISERWNQGYATEMAAVSLEVGFERLGFGQIASWALPGNKISQRVMEKLGFRYEREFLFAGIPHVLYRLTAPDWATTRSLR